MKGTLISSDYVKDYDGTLKLIELNTDTQVYTSFTSSLDFSDIHSAVNDNSITEFHVVWKEGLHRSLKTIISESISANCPGVTTFSHTKVSKETLYPVVPTDNSDKFILRLAYDENAILDSTYAKKNINLYNLYVSASEEDSIPEFYYSSSEIGVIDTLSSSFGKNSVYDYIPDTVLRDDDVQNTFQFHKDVSTSGSAYFKSALLGQLPEDKSNILQHYCFHSSSLNTGRVFSYREYGVIYDTDLKYTKLSSGRVKALFDFPTGSIVKSEPNVAAQATEGKHFYEYTTKQFKKYMSDGVLRDEEVLLTGSADNYTHIISASAGTVVASFHWDGLPDSDDITVVDEWFQTGSEIPATSLHSTASVEGLRSNFSPNQEGTRFKVSGSSDWTYVGGKTRVLVYNQPNDTTSFIPLDDITPNAGLYVHNIAAFPENNNELLEITHVENFISETRLEYIELDVEPDDVFFLKSGDQNTRFVSALIHNIFLNK